MTDRSTTKANKKFVDFQEAYDVNGHDLSLCFDDNETLARSRTEQLDSFEAVNGNFYILNSEPAQENISRHRS